MLDRRSFLSSLAEKAALLSSLAGPDRKAALQDALWAILNSKEFLYNH